MLIKEKDKKVLEKTMKEYERLKWKSTEAGRRRESGGRQVGRLDETETTEYKNKGRRRGR